ncbi:MAG: hypothetical protein ACLP1X_18590 [Polyangiaceae bacterium]
MTREELESAKADAIRDRAWGAVEILQRDLDALDRAASNVVSLVARRTDRG